MVNLTEGWRRLPREARDTLFLLGVLAWTVLPHLPRLPLWSGAVVMGLLAWRAVLAVRGAALPGRWARAAAVVVLGGLTWFTYQSVVGREAGVTLLLMLASLKTLELRARRDTFVVFFLAFFLVLTNFLFSQSFLTALAMLLAVWGLLTALVRAHMPVGDPPLWSAARLAARAALMGAPVMLLLFLLFPRVAPLWGVPQDATGRTGLSTRMDLGEVAELATDDRIALRVRFEGDTPPPERLYFRGPVLSRFDGRQWRSDDVGNQLMTPVFRLRGEPLSYSMTVEPLRVNVLPLLELGVQAPQVEGAGDDFSLRLGADLSWSPNQLLSDRLRVQAQAWPEAQHGAAQVGRMPGEALQLPPDRNPRTLAWARAMSDEVGGRQGDPARTAALVARTLAHVRQGGFTYTLAPGRYEGDHLIDGFWLDRKEGFCEHFAAAFVVIMRAVGVPARVVTGYQGGEVNPVDGWLEVRNGNAHAWAEVWLAGAGWQRVDPTGAVAPERVRRGERLRPPPGLVAGALGNVDPSLWPRLRAVWDAMDNRWNQWVLNYSRGQQLRLLKDLGLPQASWQTLLQVLATGLGVLALAGAGWAAWQQRRRSAWERAWGPLREAARRAGLDAGAELTPRRLAQALRARHGAAAEELARALLALEAARYGAQAAAAAPATRRGRGRAAEPDGVRAAAATAREAWRRLDGAGMPRGAVPRT